MILVPGRPSSETAARFRCPFCGGTAYYGYLPLIAALTKTPAPLAAGPVGVAHKHPLCATYKRLTADEFIAACIQRNLH